MQEAISRWRGVGRGVGFGDGRGGCRVRFGVREGGMQVCFGDSRTGGRWVFGVRGLGWMGRRVGRERAGRGEVATVATVAGGRREEGLGQHSGTAKLISLAHSSPCVATVDDLARAREGRAPIPPPSPFLPRTRAPLESSPAANCRRARPSRRPCRLMQSRDRGA